MTPRLKKRARRKRERHHTRQLSSLRSLNQGGKLALFIGAGLSLGCGLPSWEMLIERLMQRAFGKDVNHVRAALQNHSHINKVRLIKKRLGSNFNNAVRDCLYSEPYSISKSLESITQSRINKICTFNVDDLLEEAFQTAGVPFISVTEGIPLNSYDAGTVIFHPHGFISSYTTNIELESIKFVLSEDDYNRVYTEPYSWSNLIQINLLMQYSCIFVGISFSDPNVRRLLDVCSSLGIAKRHYAIMKSPLYAVDEMHRDLALQIKKSTKSELESFGVSPIWVRKYDEIADLFQNISSQSPT